MHLYATVLADTADQSTQTTVTGFGALLPLLLLALIAFIAIQFFSSRKRKAQQQEAERDLMPGARVVLVTGLIGQVVAIEHGTYTVRIDSNNTTQEFVREGIRRILPPEEFDDVDDNVEDDKDQVIGDQGDTPTPGMITGSDK